MNILSKENLEAMEKQCKQGLKCPDCGKPASITTGYCGKHSTRKHQCPHCGMINDTYGNIGVAICRDKICNKAYTIYLANTI